MTTLSVLDVLSTPMDKLLGIIADNVTDSIIEPWMSYAVGLHGVKGVLDMTEDLLVDGKYNVMDVGTVRRWAAEL